MNIYAHCDDDDDDVGTPDGSVGAKHARNSYFIMDPSLMDAVIPHCGHTPSDELMKKEGEMLPPSKREPTFETLNSAKWHLVETSRSCHLALHLARANTNVSKWLYCATMSLGEKVPLDALAEHFNIPRANINRWTGLYKHHQSKDVDAWKTRASKTIAEYMEHNGVHEGNALLLKDALLAFRANLVTLARDSLTNGSDPARSIGRVILQCQQPGDDRVWKRAVKGLKRTPAKALRTCLERMLAATE